MGCDSRHDCQPVSNIGCVNMKIDSCANADWLHWPEVRTLIDLVGEKNIRVVGGAIRDYLRGEHVSDVDFATLLLPQEVTMLLQENNIRVIPTGIEHGTVTAVMGDHRFEITTLRRDVATDGRRAVVAFSDNWKDDAARRDFTINALYADASGVIYDYFGGLSDLAEKRIRFIGEAAERITEDSLRILRFFRFHGRLADAIADKASLDACEKLTRMQSSLSRERVRDEIMKILQLPNPVSTIALMLKHSILVPILPGLTNLDNLRIICERQNSIGIVDEFQRLAALTANPSAVMLKMTQRLRLSTRQSNRLVAMTDSIKTDYLSMNLHKQFYLYGTEYVLDRAILNENNPEVLKDIFEQSRLWHKPEMPIKGQKFIDLGVHAGPEISLRLKAFEHEWILADFPSDEASVAALIQKIMTP
jgi:poly(A) polymerase